jgi:hypothetical protein
MKIGKYTVVNASRSEWTGIGFVVGFITAWLLL